MTLARALIHSPPAMLLDEPTRGMDVLGSQVVVDYIGRLRNQGIAVIVTTHRLDEAERLCDRFGLMHEGRLLHEGTLERTARHDRLPDVWSTCFGNCCNRHSPPVTRDCRLTMTDHPPQTPNG